MPELQLPDEDKNVIRVRIDTIADALDQAPKGRAWMLRARVGERKRWYDEPEEVER
jgi:hypothetical protein